jgi:hypothetical protein
MFNQPLACVLIEDNQCISREFYTGLFYEGYLLTFDFELLLGYPHIYSTF